VTPHMRRRGRGGEPVEGNPRHAGRAMATMGTTLALKVDECNNSGAYTVERRGFSWIELPGEAATPVRGGKGKRQDPPAPIAWAGERGVWMSGWGPPAWAGGVHREHTTTHPWEPCRTVPM
jgi:hypothetical protein